MFHDTTFQVLDAAAQPNVAIFKSAPKNLLHLFNSLDSSYVESLRQKSDRLVGYVHTSSENIRSSVIQLQVILQSQTVTSYVEQIEALLAAQPEASEAEKDQLETVIQQLREQLKASLTKIDTRFSMFGAQIFDDLSRIQDVAIKVHIPEAIEGKERQKSQLEKRLTTENERKQRLIAQKNALLDSLSVMQQRNLIDVFNDNLPSAEDIDGLDLAAPEMAAVKQGLDQYKKLLSNLSEGENYANMAEARDHLYQKIDQQNQEIKQLNEELDTVHNELEDVSILMAFDLERDRYLAEARKYLNSLEAFLVRFQKLQQIEIYSSISTLFDEKLTHLKAIEQAYKA